MYYAEAIDVYSADLISYFFQVEMLSNSIRDSVIKFVQSVTKKYFFSYQARRTRNVIR